jgi:hypothetical protein
MKYIITRASVRLSNDGNKPHHDAVLETLNMGKNLVKCWTIEIQDLRQLNDIMNSEGSLIISESLFKDVPYEINIYDDYVE